MQIKTILNFCKNKNKYLKFINFINFFYILVHIVYLVCKKLLNVTLLDEEHYPNSKLPYNVYNIFNTISNF